MAYRSPVEEWERQSIHAKIAWSHSHLWNCRQLQKFKPNTEKTQELVMCPKGPCWVQYCPTSSLMTWMMGQSAPSANLQAIKNWKVQSIQWCAAIQKDLNRVEKWTDRNMKFIKRKCQVLQLGKDNPIHQNRLEVERLQSNSAEKALGVLWTSWAWDSLIFSPHGKESEQHAELCKEEHCQQVKIGDLSSVFSTGEAQLQCQI